MTMGVAECSWCGLKTATRNGRFIPHLAKDRSAPCPNSGTKATKEEIEKGLG
jgi:hypothetical protein